MKDPRYADLYALERPISAKHRPMDRIKRAAQFAPFAALTGFEQIIEDAGDRRDASPTMGEERANALDRFLLAALQMPEPPQIVITRYVPAPGKDGGVYEDTIGVLKRVDCGMLYLTDGRAFELDKIISLGLAEP